MKVVKLQQDGKLSKADLHVVIHALENHGVVVVPTETSYGLAAKVDDVKAVKSVFALKGRPQEKTASMVVKSRAQASEYGVISCKPKMVWKAFLPGPLTLVVSAKKHIAGITKNDKTVGIRYVKTPVVNQILSKVSVPLTITSANTSGKNDVYSLSAFRNQYKNGKLPTIFINAGTLPKRKPSTVVSVRKGEQVRVLRKGPVSERKIMDVVRHCT